MKEFHSGQAFWRACIVNIQFYKEIHSGGQTEELSRVPDVTFPPPKSVYQYAKYIKTLSSAVWVTRLEGCVWVYGCQTGSVWSERSPVGKGKSELLAQLVPARGNRDGGYHVLQGFYLPLRNETLQRGTEEHPLTETLSLHFPHA